MGLPKPARTVAPSGKAQPPPQTAQASSKKRRDALEKKQKSAAVFTTQQNKLTYEELADTFEADVRIPVMKQVRPRKGQHNSGNDVWFVKVADKIVLPEAEIAQATSYNKSMLSVHPFSDP